MAAASGALFGTAVPPIFAKTPEECNAKYGVNQDVIKASPPFLLLGFAQSVSAAAGFKAYERLSPSFGERAMPPSDRVAVQQEDPGDFRLRTNRITRRRSFIRRIATSPWITGIAIHAFRTWFAAAWLRFLLYPDLLKTRE